jgi:GTP-binding protein HflX
VRQVLGELGFEDKPELLVFNQIDRLPQDEIDALAKRYGAVPVSALEARGLQTLLERAEEMLWDDDEGVAARMSAPLAAFSA